MTFTLKKAALAAAAFVAMTGQAFAQDILVVDMNKVYADSKVGKYITSQMKTLASSDEATLKSRASSLEATAKSLEGRVKGKDITAIRADTSLTTQLTDFQKRQGELARDAQIKSAELQYTQASARAEVNKRLKGIFDSIARERNASAILEQGAVLYLPNSSTADITSTVIQRLDGQMTTVSVARKSLPRQ